MLLKMVNESMVCIFDNIEIACLNNNRKIKTNEHEKTRRKTKLQIHFDCANS